MADALYFIETQSPRIRGPWFLELDRDSNSRAAVIELIRSGEADPVKVLEVIEPCDEYPRGACQDVTEEFKAEALKAAFIGIGERLFADDIAAEKWDHARDLRKHGAL